MSTFFKFVGGEFGNLSLNLSHGLSSNAINKGLSLANYKKQDGQLQMLSEPGHKNAYSYIAMRTLSQMTFATLNSLYPKYRKHLAIERFKNHISPQIEQLQEVISQNHTDDETLLNPQNIRITYRGKQANEGLVLWINNPKTKLDDQNANDMVSNKNNTITVYTYWDKISNRVDTFKNVMPSMGTKIEIPGDRAFLDLSAVVQASSGNNVVLTKVQGRDYSRKELISRNDIRFTVNGNICSNYPDVYPYKAVSDFLAMMRHTGVIGVYNLAFQQFDVTKILITDYSLQAQHKGCKNIQPYTFSCVAVESDKITDEIFDTLSFANQNVRYNVKKAHNKWAVMGMDLVKQLGEGVLNNTLQGTEVYASSYIQNI